MLEATLHRNLLKHAVGRAITCPKCANIMDFRRAVLFTVRAVTVTSTHNVISNDRAVVTCVCSKCAPAFETEVLQGAANRVGKPVEVQSICGVSRGAPKVHNFILEPLPPKPVAKPLGTQLEMF
jgi:hypothetical protein